MPLRRTPPKKKLQGSTSDLTDDSTKDELPKDELPKGQTQGTNITTRPKRKAREEVKDELRSFMEEIKGIVHEIKSQNNEINTELTSIKSAISDIRSEISSVRADYRDAMNSIADIQCRQVEMSKEFVDLTKSIEFYHANQNDFQQRLEKLETSMNAGQSSGSELKTISNTIETLKTEIRQQQQWERLMNLEVSGVPESNSEDVIDIITRIADHAGVKLTRDNVIHATRVQPRQNVSGRPKVIIVKLKNRYLKDNILAGLRKTRGVTTHDISIPGEPRRIFVNEHLTIDNKLLFKKCREFAKSKFYQFTWVKNCRIYMRKDDTSPAIYIKHDSDLYKLH